jgi:TfoX/Sxy family transcriptional regulator of competence genes
MPCSTEFIQYVCDQLAPVGAVRSRKMFGEYMIYIQDKPMLMVCDDQVFLKKHPAIEASMSEAATGYPYPGAREHYLLDIDQADFVCNILRTLEPLIPVPEKKVKKMRKDK